MMSTFYAPANPAHIKKEKAKGRELRQTQWWKQKIAKGICHFCGEKFKPIELTMEHLVPIGRGGRSTKGNCVTACKGCNSKKGSKTTVELLLDAE